MLLGMLEGAAERSEVRNLFSIFLISLHRAITEAQRESRVRRLGEAGLVKSRSSDGRSVAPHHCIHLVVVALAYCTRLGIHVAHEHDQRIGTRVYCRLSTLIQLLADGHILQLGTSDQRLGSLFGRPAIQRRFHGRIVRSQPFLHLRQGESQGRGLKILVDRSGAEQLLLQGRQARITILA